MARPGMPAEAPAGAPYPSTMALYRLADPLPEIDDPIVLAAFDGWVDAGTAATSVLTVLGDEGEPVATFDPDQLFDYRSRRPTLEIRDGRLTSLAWPEVTLRVSRFSGLDLLVLNAATLGTLSAVPAIDAKDFARMLTLNVSAQAALNP